ncbi:hypothetical protein TIFTF001_013069 [Ficus carica]|uniref:Uncharacterized protein n=1 Tax=Ficus carica TaxID=3494 RepID=A0AA87ZX14_FICCA|nr:hypothetical protein TIFTF001_013069 [Ficus carica]
MDQNPKFAQMLADGTAAVDDMVYDLCFGWPCPPEQKHVLVTHFFVEFENAVKDRISEKTGRSSLTSERERVWLEALGFLVIGFHLTCVVLFQAIPSLENKEGRTLVRQLAEEWTEHKQFTKHLLFMFHSLNNINLVTPLPLPADSISLTLFCDMVWDRFNRTIEKAIRDLIALGWPGGQEAEPDLPSYDKLSDFINRIRFKTDVPLR